VAAQYEVLRAAVVADPPTRPAAGRGLVVRGGVGTWMRACLTTAAPSVPSPSPAASRPLDQVHQELVRIWAQMAAPLDQEAAHG
jgi:hypothetical protein